MFVFRKVIDTNLLGNAIKNNHFVNIFRDLTGRPVLRTNLNFKNVMKCNFSKSMIFTNYQPIPIPAFDVHETISPMQRKRVMRKKKAMEDQGMKSGIYNVVALGTAEEYNLEKLADGLKQQDLYEAKSVKNEADVLHAIAKYKVGEEPREIFFFREGSVVLWNIDDLESSSILELLRQYEAHSYSERLVQAEKEIMNYHYHSLEKETSCLDKEGIFILSPDVKDITRVKYTFSNAMMLSVKLGIWEDSLEKYIEEIEFVTEDLKRGAKIRMSREAVLQKHGELFALRHYLNLSSDVLDTPDFYWDNEDLEHLYNQVCAYFSINKRTKVMNEKINHCVALIELLSSHLSDKHHVRLEWMVIILIMSEVMFEIIHYIDRYVH
ncbi:unnamed protein product [Phaedon cochleariae]|uniref:DUF155 domain-containing protein n=1 Tax=Phaedon cochleariae TaxID=80249 RepID=A0A9P0DIT5_PHACE|nr:unnamed protein product [Phaedon cochleariae]